MWLNALLGRNFPAQIFENYMDKKFTNQFDLESAESKVKELLVALKDIAIKESSPKTCSLEMGDLIILKANELIMPLVEEIEVANPGDRFGLNKIKEMEDLAQMAETISAKLGLSQEKIPVLKIVLGSHDFGRVIERTLGLKTTRQGIRHGVFSALFLEENHLLDDLSAQNAFIILFAVFYHPEKIVPEPEATAPEFEKDAYQACYILRDLDKGYSLEETKFVEPEGVLEQLKAHYLDIEETKRLNDDKDFFEKALSLIKSVLEGESFEESDFLSEPILFKIFKILNGPVDSRVIDYFKTKSLVPVSLLKSSYASYLALRLAFLFDFKNPEILSIALKNSKESIKKYFEFIRLRDLEGVNIIEESLAQFLR